jgi:hypothetical protein
MQQQLSTCDLVVVHLYPSSMAVVALCIIDALHCTCVCMMNDSSSEEGGWLAVVIIIGCVSALCTYKKGMSDIMSERCTHWLASTTTLPATHANNSSLFSSRLLFSAEAKDCLLIAC